MSTAMIMFPMLAQSPETFEKWASILGPVGTILATFLFAGHRGWVRWGREVIREQEERDKREKEWVERCKKLDDDWTARYAALEADKNRWLELALQQAPAVKRAVELAKTASGAVGEPGKSGT